MADPRESKAWRFAGINAPAGTSSEEFLAISERANRIAKSTTKLFCATCDAENVGIAPNERFQRGYSHSRMWSDYAGRHSGLCLIFDRGALHKAIVSALGNRDLFHGRVTYADWTAAQQQAFTIDFADLARYGTDRALRAHIRTYRRELFFHKNNDWEQEAEYRWVYFGDSPTPEFVPFKKALVGICVGQNYPGPHDDALTQLAAKFGIETIPQLAWENMVVKRIPPGIVPRGTIRPGGVHIDSVMASGPRRPLEIEEPTRYERLLARLRDRGRDS